MRLPLIKHIKGFIDEYDSDFVSESIELLEHISESKAIKDEELDVIGELLSNLYGAMEVQKMMDEGMEEREALNGFMKRVMGSIDQ
ncbi:MAG: hypothetical protein CMO34_00665 [Verrucomicrobia bacterium]|nr:hypothetical protein [Verrucomicrobiota bacterium]|tara:strand:+ start:697 stop:954 length:258 start_codon:yes stop_codon:yes gene_type:complete